MRTVCCVVFLLFHLCSCSFSTRKHIVKFTTANNNLKIFVRMTDMQPEAKNYHFLIINKNNEVTKTVKMQFFDPPSKKGEKQAIFQHNLTDEDDGSAACLELRFANDTRCARRALAVFQRVGYVDKVSTGSCINEKGCVKYLNWNYTCNALEKVPKVLITVSKDRVHQDENQILYHQGSRWRFTCVMDDRDEADSTFTLGWQQKQGNRTILSSLLWYIRKPQFTLDLILMKFDDGTTINCILYENSRERRRSRDILLKWDKNKTSKLNENTYDYKMVEFKQNSVRYKEGELINMKCFTYSNNVKWFGVTNDTINDVRFSTHYVQNTYNNSEKALNMPLKLYKKNHGDSFVCIDYELSYMTYTARRHVSKILTFLMEGLPEITTERDEPQASEDALASSSNEDKNDQGNDETSNENENTNASEQGLLKSGPVVACVAACACALVALVAAAAWRLRGRTPPHEVDTYACPNAVQYISLQPGPASSNRLVSRDDSPYAEIVGVLEPKK